MQLLEERRLLSTVTVTNANASGAGSLAAAIAAANAASENTTINFDATAFSSHKTITLGGTALSLTNTAYSTTLNGPSAGVTVDANHQSAVIVINGGVTASISNTTFTNGIVGGVVNGGTLTLTNDTVTANANENFTNNGGQYVSTDGGGINNTGTLTLTGCTVSNNVDRGTNDSFSLDHGGGGLYNGGTATLDNCVFTGNNENDGASDTAGGGAIYNGGTLTVNNTTIDNNGHPINGFGGGLDVGGGIYNAGNAVFTADTISNNTSYNDAGGIENTGGINLVNCTIANNFAEDLWGGIENSGILRLSNDTISANTAVDPASDGVYSGSSPSSTLEAQAYVANTIIAGNVNFDGTESDGDTGGSFISQGHNFIGVNNATGFVFNDLTGTTAASLNAHLSALADNGGPTKTMLPTGGPVVSGGDVSLIPTDVNTDQRGQPRTTPGNTVAIGSVQLQPQAGLQISNTSALTVDGATGLTFTVTVTNTGSSQVTGVSVTDSGLTFAPGSTNVGTFDASTGVWTIGNLAPSQVATLTVTATAPVSGTAQTTAVVTSTSGNANTAFDTAASPFVQVYPIAPMLQDDAYSTVENTPLTVSAAQGLFANDSGVGALETYLTTTESTGGC